MKCNIGILLISLILISCGGKSEDEEAVSTNSATVTLSDIAVSVSGIPENTPVGSRLPRSQLGALLEKRLVWLIHSFLGKETAITSCSQL